MDDERCSVPTMEWESTTALVGRPHRQQHAGTGGWLHGVKSVHCEDRPHETQIAQEDAELLISLLPSWKFWESRPAGQYFVLQSTGDWTQSFLHVRLGLYRPCYIPRPGIDRQTHVLTYTWIGKADHVEVWRTLVTVRAREGCRRGRACDRVAAGYRG